MAKKSTLSEEKSRRIAVAITVAGVLLIIALTVILVVQFVRMGVKQSKLDELKDATSRYEQLVEEGRSDLEYYEGEEWLYFQALKQGWVTPGN